MDENYNSDPGEELITQDTPAEAAPAENIPAQDIPAEDALAEDAPVQEVPAEDLPAEDIPAEEAPAPEIPAGGISFGGGANNAYIRQFAAAPRYGRTLEEIEQDEGNASAAVSEETRERIRASAKRRNPGQDAAGEGLSSAFPNQPSSGWMIGGKVVLVDPLDNEAPAPRQAAGHAYANEGLIYPESNGNTVVFPPAGGGYVQPIEEDVSEAPAQETPPQGIPRTGFQRLISTKKNFAVFTVIAGVIHILWNFLYFITLANRNIVMSATESSLISQGQTSYTITFESPLIGVLKFFMFLLPVFAVVWALLFKKADSKKYYYNKKTVIFFLCLIALAMLIAVIDLTALHLLG